MFIEMNTNGFSLHTFDTSPNIPHTSAHYNGDIRQHVTKATKNTHKNGVEYICMENTCFGVDASNPDGQRGIMMHSSLQFVSLKGARQIIEALQKALKEEAV